jgi:hypothetical protein
LGRCLRNRLVPGDVLPSFLHKRNLDTFLPLRSGTIVTFVGYVEIKLSLRGLEVRVPGYRSRGPGPIPGAPRFSEK